MSLIITFMFEPAKLQMNCASASGARNRRRSATDTVSTGIRAIVRLRGRTRVIPCG